MAHIIDEKKCIGCEACIPTCPVEAIAKVGEVCVIDPEACVDCGSCTGSCPTEAIAAG